MSQAPQHLALTKLLIQHRLSKGRHNNSIMRLIQQIRFVNDHQQRQQKAIMLRAIVSNRYTPEPRNYAQRQQPISKPVAVHEPAASQQLKIKTRPALSIEEPEFRRLKEPVSPKRQQLCFRRKRGSRKSMDNLLTGSHWKETDKERLELPSIKSEERGKVKLKEVKVATKKMRVDSIGLSGWTRNDFNKELEEFSPLGH